jgi:DNA mismatch endonuclease, patch repair protein
MRAQRERDTGIEREIRSRLHARGLRFRVHRRLLAGSRREVDVVFPGAKVAVFVDGCFWHGCPEHGTWPRNNAAFWREKIEGNVRRDRDTDARLQDEGWTVVRVWEHEAPADAAAHRRGRRAALSPYAEPLERACATAPSIPPVHVSPWPVRTVFAPVCASASNERRLRSTSAVAARATSRGPRRAVYGSSMTTASPAISASRSGKCSAQWPSVWPGLKTTRGAPGTGSVPSV